MIRVSWAVAEDRLPVKCSTCKGTIDEGDEYRITCVSTGPIPSAWDYDHADCTDTSMARHLRG